MRTTLALLLVAAASCAPRATRPGETIPPAAPGLPPDATTREVQVAALHAVIASSRVDPRRPVCVTAWSSDGRAVPDSAFLAAVDSARALRTARNCPPFGGQRRVVFVWGGFRRRSTMWVPARPKPVRFEITSVRETPRSPSAPAVRRYVVRVERDEGDWGETYDCEVITLPDGPRAACRIVGGRRS